jgi:transposase
MEAMMARGSSVTNRQYTIEFKVEALRLAESAGPAEAARRLGIPESSLANWIRLARNGKFPEAGTGATAMKQPSSELEAEVTRLRRENASLKLDNEILKKAAVYFAKESR